LAEKLDNKENIMKLKIIKELSLGEDTYEVGDLVEIDDEKAAQKLIDSETAEEYIEIKKIEKEEKKVEAKVADPLPIVETKTREKKTFGEMLQMVVKGEKIDPDIAVDASSVRGLNKMSTKAAVGQDHTAGDGAEVTQNDFMFTIQRLARERSNIWGKVRQIEVDGSGLKFPQLNQTQQVQTSLNGGVRFYAPGEGNDITISKLAFTNKDLTLVKLAALAGATEELLEDNNLLEQFIVEAYIDGLAFQVDDEIFNGTLAVTNPLVNATTGVAVTTASPATYANLVDIYTGVEASVRSRAEWFVSNDVYSSLMSVADAGNRLVFNPGVNGSISQNVPGSIFGLPLNVVSQLPAVTSAGAIVLTVPSKYILAVKAGGPKMAISDQVYFLSDQSIFRFTYRLDGAPEQASKVTLKDSTVVSNTAYSTP
jgi:HK97 family phage major capsid protein